MDLFSLSGRTALVTGARTGIGRAIAVGLAEAGAKLVLLGRGDLSDVSDAVVATIDVDLTDPSAIEPALAPVLAAHRIDVLVNNAGGQFAAPAEQISLKGWRAVHRLNVDAVWDLTRMVAERSMIPNREGLVVFIGFSPRRGIPLMIHSSAARAALENLAGGLAIEWSRYGIRAVCVACGAIDTKGFRSYGDAWVEEASRTVPLGRLGRPEEVASVIAFLASSGGRYVTGTTIVVDGGADAWGFGTPPPRA